MECPECKFQNIDGIKFCGNCGATFGLKCPKCSFQNSSKVNYCGQCGTKIDNRPALNKESKSERKYVTVMFTDVSGYTAMTERLDPEEVRLILNRIFKKISDIIEKFDGFIEKYIGDSIMAVFGIPRAHENDPVRAIRAALEIHAAVKSMNPWIQEKTGHPIFMHTGINTGLVITGDVNSQTGSHGLTGFNINIGSRLESLSKEDEILVGPKTYKLAKHFFNFESQKPVNVKGKTGLLDIYKVLSKKEKNKSFSDVVKLSFSGRDKEISGLNMLSDQLVSKGMGGIVFITGDPGIGKSRLVDEYKSQIYYSDILWIKSRSSSYLTETSYGTFLGILKDYAGIKNSDDDVKGWDKLEGKLTQLFPDEVPDTLPYLATLLSLKVTGSLFKKVQILDAETLKNQIFRAFFVLVKRLTYDQPLVLEFEDFHWADPSTIDLLEHLLPLVCELPILIFFIGRNTQSSPASKFKKQVQNKYDDHCTQIMLNPLCEEDILGLAGKNLNLDAMSSQLCGLIHRKCGGNPLYLEELIRLLKHNDLIVKSETTGQYTVRPLFGKVPIPDTLRGIVESSIDRLENDVKDLLKVASVIGRNFFYSLLEAIEDDRKNLDNDLSVLIGENLIRKKKDNLELEYFFYHDLIRDAAYETILLKNREKLHRRVGEAIEIIFHDRIERFYGLLSYHFAKASQWNKAQKYLKKAGDQASRIASDSEALSYYKKAMSAHEKQPGNKSDDFEKAVYQRRLGEIYFRRGEHDKALVSLKQAFNLLGISYPLGKWQTRIAILNQFTKQIIKRLFFVFNKKITNNKLEPHEKEVSNIFETMGWIDFFINQERLAFDVISGLNYAEKIGSLPRTVQGYSGMGLLFDSIGCPSIAGRYHDLSMRQIQNVDEELVVAMTYLCWGYHLDFQGKWKDALVSYEKSANLYSKIGDLAKQGNPKMMMAFVLNYQGQFARSQEICLQIAQIGLESGDRKLRGHGLQGIGLNKISTGHLDEAVLNINKSIDLFQSIPDYYSLGMAYTDLARCFLNNGKIEAAYSILKRNERMIIRKGIHGFMVSQCYNALAETYLVLFEKSINVSEDITMGKVKKYIKKTIKHAKHFKCGQPKALRLNGLFFWIKGNHKKAHTFWKKGMNLCRELGCRHEEGLLYFDMGIRLQDINYLEKSQAIFIETGAELDFVHVKKAIEKLK